MSSTRITVVAEYHDAPAEGINVVSKTLIDDLRAAGREVRVVPPASLLRRLPSLLFDRAGLTVFTHGPGVRTVLVSRILRLLSSTHIVWIATRPDISKCPGWLKGWRTAHTLICNRARKDLAAVAQGAEVIEQPIGIAPERLVSSGERRWPELRARGVPIAVHVGHLRRTRGLDRLIEVKARLGDQIEIVVVASPYFEPELEITQKLKAAGVHIDRGFIAAIADVYLSADLYLFPPPPHSEGAIELPLSVLEAVACGLPVVSTAFGALPRALNGVAGVHFVDGSLFADTAEKIIVAGLVDRPQGLPPSLNAHRLAERVLAITRAT
ncbi:glycosyltransferase [Pseudorhodobacter sp.]|uniref:glycosyltransferase n=1 Tax=Pseudorhodobacter sp. TaxID=1934400 RepID=UPI002AFDEBEA|nr:glycosyltransferase [Pseudorhodobacter sp.]